MCCLTWFPTVFSNAVHSFSYGLLLIGFDSLGGWDPFGPEPLITRPAGNVQYELDGQSALGLYRQYLSALAKGRPATGLPFPLSVRTTAGETPVVRDDTYRRDSSRYRLSIRAGGLSPNPTRLVDRFEFDCGDE